MLNGSHGAWHSRFNLLHSLLAIHVSAMTSPAEGAAQWEVITPYVLEARVINRILSSTDLGERVGCSTIHRFQGSERTAIIMDIADSRGTRRLSQMVQGGHWSLAMRLLNVAISRARDKSVIIAIRRWLRDHLSHHSLLYQVIETIPPISVAELGPYLSVAFALWNLISG
ncbi:MAG TPA: ATP-binding domain-containing protein [Firmicutes bacterium]|nr:ATP-binding domain-containing protein [Bacillota bacterium]